MAGPKTMDLTKGSVTKQILLFALPIMLGNLLQQLYNVADKAIVGQFAENGELGLAAIGATSSATQLIIGLFTGLGVGVNVICANQLGAKKNDELRQTMHTAMVLAVLCGVAVAILGILAAGGILRLLATPTDVFDPGAMYMRIYFAGVPVSLLYNFGAGILNAHGDTKRPMGILLLSGLANVVLNIILVVAFKMGVEGVAIATVVSQVLSALMILRILFHQKDQYGLRVEELKIHPKQALAIIRVGVPSGFGGIVFSISNVTIQTAVNSFNRATIIAGRTIAQDINALLYQIEAALFATCVSFSGQCYGAGEYKRIDKLALSSSLLCVGGYFVCAVICTVFSAQIVGIFNSNPEVVKIATMVLLICCWGDILYAPSEMFIGCLRGMRYGMLPTILNLLGVCLPRLLWVWLIFPLKRTVFVLMLCYPISWLFSTLVQGICYWIVRRKQMKMA